MAFLISIIRRVQRILAFLPNKKGIKLMVRLHGALGALTFGTIKMYETSKGRVHPKHWITDFHNFFLDNINTSDNVLEVGCSFGYLANSLAEKAKEVTAIDIRSDVIEGAKERFNRSNLTFINSDFFDLLTESKFDVVVLSNVLEHIDDRQKFLKKASLLGKKLLIRVPAFDRDWWVPYRKELGLEWRLNKGHFLEYTEEILRKELIQAGLDINNLFCKWGNYCCEATIKRGDN